MEVKYIDSHAHVNFAAFDADREAVIQRALDNGVWIVNVGSQSTTSQKAVEIAQKYDEGVYAIVGTHPIHTHKSFHDEEELEGQSFTSAGESFDYDFYKKLAQDPKTVAIGEVGLDYHHFNDGDDIEALKAKQKEILVKFIDLANEVGKPVMLHSWDSYDDLLGILNEHPVTKRGIVHSFIGGFRTARKFTEPGYYIGLNGVVTYSKDFDRLIKEVPLERLVVETDCPYLAPGARKGERNEPLFVREVVKHIAEIKGVSEGELEAILVANTRRILAL